MFSIPNLDVTDVMEQCRADTSSTEKLFPVWVCALTSNFFFSLRDLNYNSLVEFPTAVRSLGHLKEL